MIWGLAKQQEEWSAVAHQEEDNHHKKNSEKQLSVKQDATPKVDPRRKQAMQAHQPHR